MIFFATFVSDRMQHVENICKSTSHTRPQIHTTNQHNGSSSNNNLLSDVFKPPPAAPPSQRHNVGDKYFLELTVKEGFHRLEILFGVPLGKLHSGERGEGVLNYVRQPIEAMCPNS